MEKPGSKRIILVVSNDLEGDQRLHKVAVSLQKRSWDPLLLGRRLKDSGDLIRPYQCRRIKMIFSKGPAFYAFFNIRIFIRLLFMQADLFVANDLDTLLAVRLASRLRRKPLVYDSHEYFTQVPELVHRKRVQSIWKSIERRIQPKLDSVITVNESIADIFKNEYNKDVKVIKNLPLTNQGDAMPGSIPSDFRDCPLLIYQGAVNVGRGLEQVIEAMPLMPEFKLLIVGGGDKLDSLIRLVDEKDLRGKVYFTGRVPFEQLSWYTRQAKIGISLEQDIGMNYRFSLPNKLFDYMRAGLPVLASDLPEIQRLVKEVNFGLIIDNFSPGSLAKGFRSVWENQDLYNHFVNNALAKAPHYTWEEQEELLFDVYDEALGL